MKYLYLGVILAVVTSLVFAGIFYVLYGQFAGEEIFEGIVSLTATALLTSMG